MTAPRRVQRPPAACFTVPPWHRTLWEEHAAGSAQAQDVASAGDARAAGFGDGFLPELFHRLYAEEPAAIADPGPAARMRAKLHSLASELPELATLRTQTVRSDAWSGIGATVLGESVARALPELADDPPDADRAGRILDGMRSLGLPTEESEGTHAGECFRVAEQAASVDDSAIRRALRAGIADADAAIQEAKQACAALGWGDSLETGGAADPTVALDVARRVRNSPKLARIVALAGRMIATSRSKRASRTKYARSETCGVEPTRDLSRILPAELSALASPLRTADLVRRLGERAALGYQVRGREREAKGPIVAMLDISGSMADGDRDVWSKAVALALLDCARHDRRPFGVVLFNGGIVDSYLAPDPSKAEPAALLSVLSREPAGGTRFAPPVDRAIEWIQGAKGTRGALKRADAILITDGEASADGSADRRAALATLGAHVFGIGIGVAGAGLRAWADDVTAIDDVSRDTAAIDLIFDAV